MSSNAVVTSDGGLATEPTVAWVVIHVAMVVISAFTDSTSGLFAHARIVGASDSAVAALMLGHVAASFAWKSAQKLCRPADIEAVADPDGAAEAATDGSTDATLGNVSAVAAADGARLDPVDEHAASPIAASPISASMERRMDMTTSTGVVFRLPPTVEGSSCRPAVRRDGIRDGWLADGQTGTFALVEGVVACAILGAGAAQPSRAASGRAKIDPNRPADRGRAHAGSATA